MEPTAPAATPEPARKKKKPRAFGHRTSSIDQLGPAAANFYLMLANRRLRKLPFAEEAIDVMAPMYDFRYLVHGAGFHPFHDFEYIVIASPNVLDVSQTFLAVQTRLPRAEIIKGLDRASAAEGLVNRWQPRGELLVAEPVPIDPDARDWDPRWLVLTSDDILLYVRPEYLPQIEAGPDGTKGKTAGNFVSKIAKLKRFARREPRAGLQIVVKDINASLKGARVKGGGALPFGVPDDLELMVEASSKPRSVVKLRFPSTDEASKAVTFWHDRLGDAIAGDPKLRFLVGPLYRATKVEHEDTRVTLRNRFGTMQAREVLKVLAGVSQKMNGPSRADVEAYRKTREENWAAREGGKKLPSDILEAPARPTTDDESPGDDANYGDPDTARDGAPDERPAAAPAPNDPAAAPGKAPGAANGPPSTSPGRPVQEDARTPTTPALKQSAADDAPAATTSPTNGTSN